LAAIERELVIEGLVHRFDPKGDRDHGRFGQLRPPDRASFAAVAIKPAPARRLFRAASLLTKRPGD